MIREPDNSEVLHKTLWWWTNRKDGGPPERPSDLPRELYLLLPEVTPPYPQPGCICGASQIYDAGLIRQAAGFMTRDYAMKALALVEKACKGVVGE